MSRVKGFFLTPDEKGELKFEWLKAITIAATTGIVTFLMLWGIWVTSQCNVVATNKNLIVSTDEQRQIDISSNKASIEKNNGIHHMRHNKIDAKYDSKMTDMHKMLMQTNTLIVEMLIQKNNEVQMEKEQMQRQNPKWPVSPTNGK